MSSLYLKLPPTPLIVETLYCLIDIMLNASIFVPDYASVCLCVFCLYKVIFYNLISVVRVLKKNYSKYNPLSLFLFGQAFLLFLTIQKLFVWVKVF